jgi:LPXTG-motif cell wall-anchored protein
METQVIVAVLIGAAILLVGLGAWYYYRRRTSERLKQHFGPEYDQTVRSLHSQERAEAELKDREKRVSKYKIVSLPQADRARYQETWMSVQGRFVDQPQTAVAEANRLVQEVMHRCGYPLANFEQSAADLSVDHPHVVENYRMACRIVERSRSGAADTEELRQAIVYYRALFNDLLQDGEPQITKGKRPPNRTKSRKDRAYPN